MKRLILVALCGALGACSSGDHEDLKRWMAENSKDLRGNIPKLPEVKPYQPVPYDVEGILDPFKASKIEPESKNRQGTGQGGAFQPDFEARDLRNSLLEKYPVESLKMIGYLNVNRRPIAVIQVEDKIKQVKVGEYLGLDFGMVTNISDKEVVMRELIQDSAGDWSERTSSLYLQGKEGGQEMKFTKYAMAVVMATCLAMAGSLSAQTATTNSIEAMVAAIQGDNIAVKIDLKEALTAPPTGFSVANPAKIAFDFPSTANGIGKNSITFKEGDLQSANVVQVGDRTRVVLNLTRSLNYTTRLDGKSLYIVLAPIPSVGSLAERVTQFTPETAVGKRHTLQDVAFRRGKDGEGRVIVDLNNTGTGIDIRQQGKSLIVDFLKTSAPENLRRKLDVTDFGTPVTSVETKQIGDNVRMTITPHGIWEHNAYQSENQFVIEVKKIIEDPNKLVQGTKTGYQGPRVSINYQNGDVRALLRLMAEELGLNAVISETVTGTTTLVLKDVPADQVIDIIFQQKGLDMRKKGNIMMIAPRDEIATREKLDFESRQQIADLEPIIAEKFSLNYQKAVDIARLLSGVAVAGGAPSQRLLSKRGNAVADPQSNILFVNDIPSKLEEIRKFITAIDTGARQVMIEARVVEAQDSFNRDLGVRLNFLSAQRTGIGGSGIYGGGGTYSPSGQVTNQAIGVNLPSFTNVGGTLAFSLFNASLTRILNLEIAALETDGLGKIVSSPRVITANNVKAKIQDGTEIPYVTTATGGGVATQNVSFKTAALSLEATPQITPEGTVRMQLIVKKEEPDWTRAVLGNPPIKTSTVETNVVVENGGTVVIGGVYVTKKENVTEKVPLLGDIPFFGYLFKYQNDAAQRRELLFFITPRIISDKLQIN